MQARVVYIGALLAFGAGCGDEQQPHGGAADTDGAAPAQQTTGPHPGRATYTQYCAGCHEPGPGHPGTMRLATRLGETRAVLRERTDLTPEYVSIIVRNGLQMMPPFRPSEIDDVELDLLSQFVTMRSAGQGATGK